MAIAFSLFSHLVGIIGASATEELSEDVAKEVHGLQATIHEHSQRHGGVNMAATDSSNQKDNQS